MSPPPPRPDDEPPPLPPPPGGWEVVEPARDPLLDDPLFAELVEDKPLPELKVEPPVAEAVDDLPTAEVAPRSRATPVDRPRPRPVVPPPPKTPEEPTEAPKPRVFAACAVLGCFGLGFLGAMGFIGWAALTLVSGLPDDRRPDGPGTATRPGPVALTKFVGTNKSIPLSGGVDAVGRAAGGRYLLMRTPRPKQIVAFDPNTGDLLGHRFDCWSDSLFAGSASKLFIYRKDSDAGGQELQRWDLASGARELAVAKPANVVAPAALVVGAGVDGPVYLVSLPSNGTATVRAFDPDTLELKDTFAIAGWRPAAFPHVRPSDDGSVWGVTSSDGAQLVRFPALPLKGAPALLALPRFGTMDLPITTPARDGSLAYTPFGVVTATAPPQRIGKRSPFTFPTAHGSGLFLSVERDIAQRTLGGTLRLHVASDPDFGVEIPNVEVPRGLKATDDGYPPPDQRIHVWPAAGLAAVIPSTAGAGAGAEVQTLEVRRIDVPGLLSGRESEYLVFGSEPQLWAFRGREWRYRPVVWSGDNPPPKPVLFTAPSSMTIQNGDVVWTPGRADTRADVTLRVTAGDLTTDQRFRVTVLDEPDDD